MLKTRSDVPQISKCYQSPQIVNEIIAIMSQNILRGVLVKIREAGYFGIMGDETREIWNKEQLVVWCRWVNECYNVNEDPLGLF